MKSLKLVVLGLLSVSLAGCFLKPPQQSKRSKVNSQIAVENEFLFAGNKDEVAAILNRMNISHRMLPIVEGESYQVKYYPKKGQDIHYEQIADALKGHVEIVEPNYKVYTNYSMNKRDWLTDRYFFKQWGLNNIGQSAPFGIPGQRGADMSIMEAWKLNPSGKVVVAVVDTGIDYTHPDLKDRMWINHKEAPANGGIPGVDDDGNGYTDDVYGYNFVTGESTELFYGLPGSPDPMDDSGHGTHCAGGIAAAADNDIGVAGVVGKANVELMAVKGLASVGGNNAELAKAIHYAVKNKADIISASWGGEGKSELLEREIRRAGEAGVLFVAAAGNSSVNTDVRPHYPSGYGRKQASGSSITNVISVGASDNRDNPADFSNYGHQTVDIFAPGVMIISTYPTNLTSPGYPPYAIMSGTSMAAPYVAGVAALMMAYNSSFKGNPELVRETIINTADVVPGLIGRAVSNGRINAYKAMTAQDSGPKLAQWIEKPYPIQQTGHTQELVDIRHEIKVEGASFVKVHFDFVQVAEPYDSIYIYDKNLKLITRVENYETTDYWSPAVPGDTVYVRFVNSYLQRTTVMMSMEASENACSMKGGTVQANVGGKYSCQFDSTDSSSGGDGNKKFNSFYSEGFSIDRVSYLTGQLETKNNEGLKQ